MLATIFWKQTEQKKLVRSHMWRFSVKGFVVGSLNVSRLVYSVWRFNTSQLRWNTAKRKYPHASLELCQLVSYAKEGPCELERSFRKDTLISRIWIGPQKSVNVIIIVVVNDDVDDIQHCCHTNCHYQVDADDREWQDDDDDMLIIITIVIINVLSYCLALMVIWRLFSFAFSNK